MPRHTPKERMRSLMEVCGWQGDPLVFQELVPVINAHISDPYVREAMDRYYGGSRASQVVNPITGKPTSTDSRFYQHLEKGRMIYRTIFNFTPEELDELKKYVTRG